MEALSRQALFLYLQSFIGVQRIIDFQQLGNFRLKEILNILEVLVLGLNVIFFMKTFKYFLKFRFTYFI